MDILKIEGTENIPKITLNHTIHLIEFSGESRPDNPSQLFNQVFNWIETYKKYLFFMTSEYDKEIKVIVNFKMEYFNSVTFKFFNEILTELAKFPIENEYLTIDYYWYFENEDVDMKEAGEEFSIMTKIPFKLVAY